VRSLRPLRRMATAAQRRAILQAGQRPSGDPLFGSPFLPTHSAISCAPGVGDRSLATLVIDRRSLSFSGVTRQGRAGPDYRVTLELPGLGPRRLPVVDHFLLAAAALAGEDVTIRLRELERIVGQMGERIAVRTGLTRPYAPQGASQPAAAVCWLMADGFFSLDDPQP